MATATTAAYTPRSKRTSTRVAPRPRPSSSRLTTLFAFILIPGVLLSIFLYPLLLLGSLLPIVGFIALPSFLFVNLLLLYATTWIPYLALAQHDLPAGERAPFIPFSPFRCLAVDRIVYTRAREAIAQRIATLFVDWCYRRVMVMGGKYAKEVVRENVQYGPTARHLLDVYMADVRGMRRHVNDDDDDEEGGVPILPPAPVIFFLPGGGWMFGNKRYYTQLALNLRRQGWVVVIPNITKFPSGRAKEMVSDIRLALSWVHTNIHQYRGDSSQIHVLGHGSGAHLLLLTVVQDAVVRSRDEYWVRAQAAADAGQNEMLEEAESRISAGIRRLEIWGEEKPLPPIQGMVLMAGISDVIKQIRYEAKQGIEHVSPLRRALGPTHALSLMSSPSHLIYGAKQLIDPRRMPPKVLIIHGGKDVDVPIVQSVLLKTLLVGVGVQNVRLRAYRHLGHLETITALMRNPTRTHYGSLLLTELRSFLAQPFTPPYYSPSHSHPYPTFSNQPTSPPQDPPPRPPSYSAGGGVGTGTFGESLPVPSFDTGAVDSTEEMDLEDDEDEEEFERRGRYH